jgi:chromate reductase, NAD(P)H dehydrogenase (quinone)
MWKFFIFLSCFLFSMTLNAQTKVLAFAGSARADSANKKLALEAARIAHELGADVTFIDLKDYPISLYEADLETENGMPKNAKYIRRLMIESQVILIASPEYNGSVSPLLKNTIDWTSRSETKGSSREAFKGKKFVIMSATPGTRGAKGLTHLRDIIEDIGGIVVSPSVVVTKAYQVFDGEGKLKDQKLSDDLQRVIQGSI